MTTEVEWPRSTVHPQWRWPCRGGEGGVTQRPRPAWLGPACFLRIRGVLACLSSGVFKSPRSLSFMLPSVSFLPLMPSDSSLCAYVLNFVAFMLRSDTGFAVLVGALDNSPCAMVTFKHLPGGLTGQPGGCGQVGPCQDACGEERPHGDVRVAVVCCHWPLAHHRCSPDSGCVWP